MHNFSLRRIFPFFLFLVPTLFSGCKNNVTTPGTGAGKITVNCSPDELGINWRLAGPNDFLATGPGDSTLASLASGSYTVSWELRSGWVIPPDSTASLDEGQTVIFSATYQIREPFADTATQLMANFKTAYEAHDSLGYYEMLAPGYRMVLKSTTTFSFPELGENLDRAEERRIADHMFGEAIGHDPNGNLVNPITSVAFQTPEQLTAWSLSLPDDPIPATPSALFNVMFEFNRAGDRTLQVSGQIKFYTATRESLHLGTMRPYFQLMGMWDFTNGSKRGPMDNEDYPFGSVKGLYR